MKSLTVLSIFIAAAACAAPANPPSLAQRAIETRSDVTLVAPVVTAPKTIDPALAVKVNALVIEARAGEADFAKALGFSNNAITSGRNAATGSDAAIAAELALSALQVARQRSAGALADIDALAINQSELASRDATVGGIPELQATQAQIEAIVAKQTARLEALTR